MTLKRNVNLKKKIYYSVFNLFIIKSMGRLLCGKEKNIRHAMLIKCTEIVVCTYIF